MTNTGYYNWSEILSKFDDKKLFNAFVDRDSNPEKKKIAEKILLERKIIKKNSEGKYIKEEVERKHLYLLAYNLKNESREDTINKLTNDGLNYETSTKIVDAYLAWKRKKTKLIRPWLFIAPVLFVSAVIADYTLIGHSTLTTLVVFPFVLFFIINVPTDLSFSKKHFFKVFPNDDNTPSKKATGIG